MTSPEISVLLATFNGADYIESFLDSLSAQKGVLINLYVSDDGSTDQTLKILDKYVHKFKSINKLSGPQLGPKTNFLYLLQNAQGRYFCFADQDDIWLPEKLLHAIERIGSVKSPRLFTSSVMDFHGYKISRQPYRLPLSAMRNNSQGCTMVFNLELRDLLLKLNQEKIVMHDWAAILLAQIHGQVIYDEKAYVYYRLHANNFIGHRRISTRLYKYLTSLVLPKSKESVINQAFEIKKTIMEPYQNSLFTSWCNSVNSSFVLRAQYLLSHKKIYFTGITNVACALQILMGKYRV